MKKFRYQAFVFFLALFNVEFGFSQQMIFGNPGMSKAEMEAIDLSEKQKDEIISALIDQIKDYYILKENVKKTVDQLLEKHKKQEYKDFNNPVSLSAALNKDLIEITNDAHFKVLYNPKLSEMMSQMRNGAPGSSAGNSGQVRTRRMGNGNQGWPDGKENNFFLKQIEIMAGNVGYLKIEKIPSINKAKSTVDAAMGFLQNSDALILDLRDNPGGFAGFIPYLMSYFFPEGKKLLFSREMSMSDEVYNFFTEEKLPHGRLPNIPLYILINENTGSAATNMTYTLQQHDRAKVIGVTTEKGIMGAHSASPFPLNHGFLATIPIARVVHAKTKKNWNFTGVVPDITTEKDAKTEAHKFALESIKSQ